MQAQMLGHGVLGLAMLTTLLWMGLLPADLVLRAAELLLVWGVLSTLLVACAGAWVAFGWSRR
jgi:hypothetical protein